MDKLKIKEAIVVEGRDDSAALRQAVDAFIIETHGFGISRRTWELLARAYEEKGLIIMTDPDFAGEEIRKRISARFPASKHVYMPRRAATRKGDIGVENAAPEDIVRALGKVAYTRDEGRDEFTAQDLDRAGLTGGSGASKRRQALGEALGIGYANSGSFLKKLNRFGVSREQFEEALAQIDARGVRPPAKQEKRAEARKATR